MNAIPFPRAYAPPPAGDGAYLAACAVHADAHIGVAMERLGDAAGALYERRCRLSDAERKAEALMRDALVALSHARNLLAPCMVERGT